MHQFWGLAIDEWGSVVSILTGVGVVIGLIIKMTMVMTRLENTMTTLNETLHNLISDNRELKERFDRLEDRFQEHIGEAKVRNQKIKALEKGVFHDGKD